MVISATFLYCPELIYLKSVAKAGKHLYSGEFFRISAKGNTYLKWELASRYNGTYTLNPARAELMYYPTFFGRNENKKNNRYKINVILLFRPGCFC
jgi:hypothetical protein